MFKRSQHNSFSSQLFDQTTFFPNFRKDLGKCRQSLIIESPFIRINRVKMLLPFLTELRNKDVKVLINTRDPSEHEPDYQAQALLAVKTLQDLGITVLFTTKHHRKLAIIDRKVMWEGSLNILSYYDSCEIMRRIESSEEADELLKFVGLESYLKEASESC